MMGNYLEDLGIANNYKIRCIQAGQPRCYADSEYVYEIIDLQEPLRSHDEVLVFCRKSLRDYPDKKSFLSPYLSSFTTISPKMWSYHVTEPYCD
jgi:hypothetical protein